MPIGRFQVMAVLQAARAYKLGLPLNQAKSWGLNRAIFYAAAKKGYFRKKKPPARKATIQEIAKKPLEKTRGLFYLGDEAAYYVETQKGIYFTIGGKIQTEKDFQKQIESRFYPIFHKVWEEALQIIGEHPIETLISQRKFYKEVYEPLRDILAEKWSRWVKEARKQAGEKTNEGKK